LSWLFGYDMTYQLLNLSWKMMIMNDEKEGVGGSNGLF